MVFRIFIFIFFGILPSLTWLFFYLKKDDHPEPKRVILKIFLWGALITLPVFFIQIGLTSLLENSGLGQMTSSIIYWFLIISFSEELFKYLVVRLKAFNSSDMDEPLDIMLYMVVSALGFSALENVLYMFSPLDQTSFNDFISTALLISFIRFIGATFLHTLCSAVIGYAIAISLCDQKNRILEALSGIIMAVVLHGAYDFSIMTLEGNLKFAVPIIIILTLAVLVFWGFERLKKMRGICKLR